MESREGVCVRVRESERTVGMGKYKSAECQWYDITNTRSSKRSGG